MESSASSKTVFGSRKIMLVSILSGFGISLFLLILYKSSLAFPLTNGDDLVILSRVAQLQNPFQIFYSDWGLGNYAYRPLHSFSIWIIYRMVGVWALPNQAINLGLHIVNVLLVNFLLLRQKTPNWVAILATLCFGTSMYAVSPTTWISDRPTIMVALVLNITLILLFGNRLFNRSMTIVVFGLLFLLAFLCKESGLIVPLSAILVSLFLRRPNRNWIYGIACLSILVYFLFRGILFGGNAFNYAESGYLLGWVFYPDNVKFPLGLQILVYVDNVVKNMAATVLPIFSPEGGFLPWSELRLRIGMVIAIGILFFFSVFRKQTTLLGKLAIFILLINAIIHFQLFRYRALYLGFEAIAIFIGASFCDISIKKEKWASGLLAIIGVAVVMFNGFYIQDHLVNQMFKRMREINRYELSNVITERRDQLSMDIISQVLEQYKRK
jgi:hypothetical protein